MMQEKCCPYHYPAWWNNHPRALASELNGAIPIFDFILWQTPDNQGMFRTLSYCSTFIGEAETEEQFNSLVVYITDALIRAMHSMGLIEIVDEEMMNECKAKFVKQMKLH